jgi:hypothetical protein
MDAWADAEARDLDTDDDLTESDIAAAAAGQAHRGPLGGGGPGLEQAPLCTVRLGERPNGEEAWAVGKVLKSELMRVHVALYGPWSTTRQDVIRPWELRVRPPAMASEAIAAKPDFEAGVGHLPLARSSLSALDPRFAGLTTLTSDELDGYQIWREADGGTFDTLRWMLDWPDDAVVIES